MFKPRFILTPKIVTYLLRIEAIREEFTGLPITAHMLNTLRDTARYESIHYSTQIEGNRLTQKEVIEVVKYAEHLPGRERCEKEVLGYFAALEELELLVAQKAQITETIIKKFHALVMGGGKKKVKPTPYRDGQNVIRDSLTHAIVYLPPEAHDVPSLMHDLVQWIAVSEKDNFPYPLLAALAHYQFATIHPYFDGNGRTARLLTTFILHRGSYDLKGIYSLEEYYAKRLQAYYQALSIGPSHSYYYKGRETADITPWLDYFCAGMLESFEKVRMQALRAYKRGDKDSSVELRKLSQRQRRVLSLFEESSQISSKDIEKLLNISSRNARMLCQQWVREGFLAIANPSKKARLYALAELYHGLIQ